MRKLLTVITLAGIVILVACSGGDKKESKEPAKDPAKNETASLSDHPDYTPGLELVTKSDCLTCHRATGKLTGPSYEEVANKYAGADDKKIEELANTIIKGVKVADSKWAATQDMTPHPNVPMDDAKKMVKYILLLKK